MRQRARHNSARPIVGRSYVDLLVAGSLIALCAAVASIGGAPIWLAVLVALPAAWACMKGLDRLASVPVHRRNARMRLAACERCEMSLAAGQFEIQHPDYVVTCPACAHRNVFDFRGHRRRADAA